MAEPLAIAAPEGGHLVLAFPREDTLFFAAVARQIAGPGPPTPEDLADARRRLHGRYPRADLYHQPHVDVRGLETSVWLAYRDGRSAPTLPAGRWWEERGVARAVVTERGAVVEPNRHFLALLTPHGREPVAAAPSGAISPELCAEIADPGGWLAATGTGGSTTVVYRSGHDRLHVEFHAVWEGAGSGRHVLFIRTEEERQAHAERRAIAASSIGSMPTVARELVEGAPRRWTRAGERLPSSVRGRPWSVLVVAGIVRVYLSVDGSEPTVLYARPGTLTGTHLLPREEASAVAVQSVTACLLIEVDPAAIERLVEQHARFARGVAAEGRRQLVAVVRSHAQRSGGSLPQRLARELLLLVRLTRDTFLPVTEQQLADSVGSIRESVARTIGDFRREGSIATTRFGVIVLDEELLRRRSAGEDRGA